MNFQLTNSSIHPQLIVALLAAVLVAGAWSLSTLADDALPDDTIQFSQDSQVSRRPPALSLAARIDGTIRYTTNGSAPTASGTVYRQPISINKSTSIRAQLFDDAGKPVGPVYTKSYIVADYEPTLPVISIVTDWAHLYALHDYPLEHSNNPERPITLEYFTPDGQRRFAVENGGIKIYDETSQMLRNKKSYKLSFSKADNPEYPLFDIAQVAQFNTLILHAGYSDGLAFSGDSRHTPNFALETIGGQVMRNLYRKAGQPAVHGNWVLLYLNGQYWGLYNLTGQIDRDCPPEIEAGQLLKEQVQAEILTQADIVRPYIQMEVERWAPQVSVELFNQDIQNMLKLADQQDAEDLVSLNFLQKQSLTSCQ